MDKQTAALHESVKDLARMSDILNLKPVSRTLWDTAAYVKDSGEKTEALEVELESYIEALGVASETHLGSGMPE